MSAKKNAVQPLFDYALIRPLDPEDKTASGILLPDSAKEKPQKGRVMAVGPGTTDNNGKKVEVQVEVDQVVLYKKWGGNEIKVNGEEWLLVEQKDVMAIINE